MQFVEHGGSGVQGVEVVGDAGVPRDAAGLGKLVRLQRQVEAAAVAFPCHDAVANPRARLGLFGQPAERWAVDDVSASYLSSAAVNLAIRGHPASLGDDGNGAGAFAHAGVHGHRRGWGAVEDGADLVGAEVHAAGCVDEDGAALLGLPHVAPEGAAVGEQAPDRTEARTLQLREALSLGLGFRLVGRAQGQRRERLQFAPFAASSVGIWWRAWVGLLERRLGRVEEFAQLARKRDRHLLEGQLGAVALRERGLYRLGGDLVREVGRVLQGESVRDAADQGAGVRVDLLQLFGKLGQVCEAVPRFHLSLLAVNGYAGANAGPCQDFKRGVGVSVGDVFGDGRGEALQVLGGPVPEITGEQSVQVQERLNPQVLGGLHVGDRRLGFPRCGVRRDVARGELRVREFVQANEAGAGVLLRR